MRLFAKLAAGAASLASAAIVGAGTAAAVPVPITYSVQYFTVTPAASPAGDFNTQCCYGPVNDVLSTLDPTTHMPVWNGTTGALKDVSGSNVIEWWTPGTYNGDVVASDGTGTATNPYANGALFPPQGTGGSDSPSLQTAIFSGSFNLATVSHVVFNLGADDDAYLYVDGSLVAGLGGVHANVDLPTTAVTLGAGTHAIELFYADRNVTQASLNFSLDSTGITPVPEPLGVALFGSALLGLGLARQARARR